MGANETVLCFFGSSAIDGMLPLAGLTTGSTGAIDSVPGRRPKNSRWTMPRAPPHSSDSPNQNLMCVKLASAICHQDEIWIMGIAIRSVLRLRTGVPIQVSLDIRQILRIVRRWHDEAPETQNINHGRAVLRIAR